MKQVSLRAKSLRGKTSLKLALARTLDLIRFMTTLPEEKVDLWSSICENEDIKPDTPAPVARCGSVGCVGGWIALRYSPDNFRVSRYGALLDNRGKQWDSLYVAKLLIRAEVGSPDLMEVKINGDFASQKFEAISRLVVHADALTDAITIKHNKK